MKDKTTDLINSLGSPRNEYIIKADKSGKWWIEHKYVGSGEPLEQWLKKHLKDNRQELWVDINKYIPKRHTTFLVFINATNWKHVHYATLDKDGFRLLDESGNHTSFITHWMPLPEPPTKK